MLHSHHEFGDRFLCYSKPGNSLKGSIYRPKYWTWK